jgi:phosphatidylglycerol:prolipoprotein diacylglycerol transferase
LDSAGISFPIFGEDFVMNVPTYVSLFGFKLYLYGFFITLGFILAGLYLYKRRNALCLTKDNVLDLIILAVPFGIVGARIYYAIFNFSDYFGPGNWLNIFKVREGGLAVYGGVIGGAVAFFVYSRIKKIPVGKLFDAAGFGLFIGQAVGRWGNFFNREAYGVATDLPWRMGLTTQHGGVIYVHPTFLYESLWNIVGFVLLHIFSKKKKPKYFGQCFLLYVAWYGLGRFMIEGLRIDSLYLSGTDIRVSKLLAALSFCFAVALLIRNHLRGTKHAELVGAAAGDDAAGDIDEAEAEADAADEADAVEVEADEADTADEADVNNETDAADEADTTYIDDEAEAEADTADEADAEAAAGVDDETGTTDEADATDEA